MAKIYYQDKDRKRLIGEIRGRTFFKFVDDDKHLMELAGNTPGIQLTIDNFLNRFDNIAIKTKRGLTFKSTRENWTKHRFLREWGHGAQWFMGKKYWEIIDILAPKLF